MFNKKVLACHLAAISLIFSGYSCSLAAGTHTVDVNSQAIFSMALLPVMNHLGSWHASVKAVSKTDRHLRPVVFSNCNHEPRELLLDKTVAVGPSSGVVNIMSFTTFPDSGTQSLIARLPDATLINSGAAADWLLLGDSQSPLCKREDLLAVFQEPRLDFSTRPSCCQHSGESLNPAIERSYKPDLLVSVDEDGMLIFIIVEIDERGVSYVRRLKTNVLVSAADARYFIQRLSEYSNVRFSAELRLWFEQLWQTFNSDLLSEEVNSGQTAVTGQPFGDTESCKFYPEMAFVIECPQTGLRPLQFLLDGDYSQDRVQASLATQWNDFLQHDSYHFSTLDDYILYINRQLEENVSLRSLFGDLSYFLQHEINYIGTDQDQRLEFKKLVNFMQMAVMATRTEDLRIIIERHLQESSAYVSNVRNLWWWCVCVLEQSGQAWAAEEYMRGLLRSQPENHDLFSALIWHLIHEHKMQQAEQLVQEWSQKNVFSQRFFHEIRRMFFKHVVRKIQSEPFTNFKPFTQR